MNRLLVFSILCFATSGCSPTEYFVDAGPDDAAAAPSGRLVIESEPSVTLAFGEEAALVVRYTEDDEPVAGATIQFALEGRAHDSTIAGDLEIATDAEGRVSTAVLAGSTAAVFRVRISAERAAPAYVNVSVGNMGFGALTVGAVYSGGREAAARRVISVYSEMDCVAPEDLPPFPDRTITIEDPMVDETRFVALPAGLRYAIVGRVEGASGATLATACADAVFVDVEGEARVDLVFEDEPLALAESYDVELGLAPTATSTLASEIAAAAGL